MWKSVHRPFIKNLWPRPQNQCARWLPNAQMRAAADFLMEKNETTIVSKARWQTKSKKEVTGDVFICSCHGCLQQHIRIIIDNIIVYTILSMISWTLNVATRLTSSSHNSVSIVF